MSASSAEVRPRETSYGESPLTLVDRFGVALSRRAVLRTVGARDDLDVLDLGCGFDARMLEEARITKRARDTEPGPVLGKALA